MLLLTGLAHSGRNENLNGTRPAGYSHLTGAELAKKEGGRPFSEHFGDQAAANA